jgi:hypothetical protein
MRVPARGRFLAVLSAGVLSLLLSSTALAAQPSTGNIYGKITDQDGILLSDVHITLRAPQVASVSTVTDPTGLYRLVSLAPGPDYEIAAELTGFKKVTKAPVVVQAGTNTEINLILERQIPDMTGWSHVKAAFERLVREPSPMTDREFFLSISDK